MSEQVHSYCCCLYYAANALARNISRLGEDAFARTGLVPSLGFLPMTVNRNPGVQPLEAAEIMLLDSSTVTRLVEKLQSKCLVTRKTQGTYLSGGAGDPYTKFNPYCGSPIHADSPQRILMSTLGVIPHRRSAIPLRL